MLMSAVMSLLSPGRRVVPFTGREAELADLLAWCRSGERTAVRLVTAPGGVGKTRLAVELAAALSRRWRTVWLDAGDRTEKIAATVCAAGRWARPVLVIVDDAAHDRDLAARLDAVASAACGKLRVLGLARTAWTWWMRLRQESALLGDPRTVTTWTGLPVRVGERAAVVDAAVAAFARELGLPRPSVSPAPGEFSGLLGGPRVLGLHAAALAAVVGAPLDDDLPDDDAAVVRMVLSRDRHPADASLPVPARLVEQHVARVLTERPELVDVLTRDVLTRSAPAGDALGGDAPAGGHPAGGALAGDDPRETAWRIAVFACELDLDWPGPPEGAHLATRLLEAVLERLPDDVGLLLAVRGLLPWRLGLDGRGFGELLGPRLLDLLPDHDVRNRADAHVILCRSLSARDPAAGLRHAEAALTTYRDQASSDRDFGAGLLVGALGARGRTHFQDGDLRAAAADFREALGIARARPDLLPWIGPVVGPLLNNLCAVSQWGNELTASWDHLQEALVRLRADALRDPAADLIGLGAALVNAGAFADTGQLAAVSLLSREALAVWRRLARWRPDLYERFLAMVLHHANNVAAAEGDVAGATAHAREALAIWRRIYDGTLVEDRYRLAEAIAILGGSLSTAGRLAEAEALEREAVELRRALGDHDPRYPKQLAASLANLGITLSRAERFDEALAVTVEAVAITRRLHDAEPRRFAPELARALSNLNVRHTELGALDAAAGAAREAVELLRPLAAAEPESFSADLAAALLNLGGTLTDLDRPADAVARTGEAVRLYERLAASNPDRHRPDLARALVNLAAAHHQARNAAQALRAVNRAIRIRDELTAADPRHFAEDRALAVALRDRIAAEERGDAAGLPGGFSGARPGSHGLRHTARLS